MPESNSKYFRRITANTAGKKRQILPESNSKYCWKHATCPAHLILDLITQIILGEHYRSLSSSLYSILHSPVTSSLLGLNIVFSTLFSNTLSLRCTPQWATKCHTRTQQQQEKLFCISLYFWTAKWKTKVLHRVIANILGLGIFPISS